MNKIRILSIFLAAALLFGCVSVFGVNAKEELNFGKMKLSQMARAEDYLAAYDALYEAVEAGEEFVELYSLNLTEDEFDMILYLYVNDSGEHYFIENGASTYTYQGEDRIIKAQLYYLDECDKSAYGEAVAKYASFAKDASSEYEKALILHDALIKGVVYKEGDNAHNSYGALVEGEAVCEGYAEAYQVLLEEVGIMSYVVRGWGGGERHAWNLVRLDGKFYYSDLTWNDPVIRGMNESEKPIFYAYFNVPDEFFEDHFADDDYDILPECTDTDKMSKELTVIERYTVENVSAAFKNVNGKAVARIYYAGDGEDNFYQWIAANYIAVWMELGVYGSISYISCGAEHYIEISSPLPEHTYDNDCDATCNVCGRTRAVTHKYADEWYTTSTEHWHECTVCHAKSDKAEHDAPNGICEVCGKDVSVTAGDVDGKDGLSADDAIYLLYRIFFGENQYPVNQACDFDGNGKLEADDAIYLLYRVFFGESTYPLH